MWFLLLIALNVQALDTTAASVEQAQTLALKKNRKDACATLVRALNALPAPAKGARTKLTDALQQLSKVFFTDKGQRTFESGQSQMFENPEVALAQLKEALAIEDDNIVILNSLAKIQLVKQDCDGAAASLARARALNPLAGETAVLSLRTLLCQNNITEMRDRAKALPTLEKWEDQFVRYLMAQESLQAGSAKKAFDSLSRVAEEQPQFPETYFYLARANSEMERDNEPQLQKYISLCKAVTAKERKRFSLEPRLCAHLKEAQDELAGKSTDL